MRLDLATMKTDVAKSRAATVRWTLALALLVGGCATHIKPTATTNPTPAESFSSFGRFELEPIALSSAVKDDAGNRDAASVVQGRIQERLGDLLRTGSLQAARAGNPARALAIQPRVEELKVVSSAQRVWGGALAGSSAIIVKVRYLDKATGKTIAEPQFYQRASAMAGAWTFGGHDRGMLTRVADLVADYTVANYASAVGGPTGASQE